MNNPVPPEFHFTKEMETLLAICRARLEGDTGLSIGPDNLNTGLVRAAMFHRVIPFIYPWLKKHLWENVGQNLQKSLLWMAKRQKIKSLRLTAELTTIAKLFRQQGLETISLKGPLMTIELYGNLSDRHQGDIDLLGSVKDLHKVRLLLEGLGYQLEGDAGMLSTALRFKAYMKSTQHVLFVNHQKKVRLEYHYRLFKNPNLMPLPLEELKQNLREIQYGGVTIKRLSLLDSVLYLFVHGSNHEWYRLKWLLDIAYLTRLPDLDWRQLYVHAKGLGVERMVQQGLQLAHKMLGAKIPEDYPLPETPHRTITKLVRRGAEKINNSAHGRDIERKFYLLKLRRGLRYKNYILWMQLHLDFHQTGSKLPDPLFFLHYLINPLLWFYRKTIGRRWANRKKNNTGNRRK